MAITKKAVWTVISLLILLVSLDFMVTIFLDIGKKIFNQKSVDLSFSKALSMKKKGQDRRAKQPKKPFPFLPRRVLLSHNKGYGDAAGVPYGSDYTTLGAFFASDYSPGSVYPFLDLRAHRFDNDTYALNIGIGGRYIPEAHSFCQMFGVNVFYDWRQGCLNQYNQVGVGVEILGRRWDIRANGYIPVGAKTAKLTCVFNQYEGGYVISHEMTEITTYACNAEVGWLAIASKNFLLYFAGGPYSLSRKSRCFDTILGGEVRVRPQYKDYIFVDARYSYDNYYQSIWQITWTINLPLYQIKGQNKKPCKLKDRQIYQPVERFETMPLINRSCWKANF
ncbi:MAG TPA: inverse autotransporter beta domain-containing protein [Chlamydiales bacterium]|nr:inverse autotransporter beta domain-containing protein [Chlamydiales bacterium]